MSKDSSQPPAPSGADLGSADTMTFADELVEPSHRKDVAPAAELARGDELAHFIVLDELGRGGMGVVYAAYDPRLDRKVALKLLRPDTTEGGSVSTAKRRLLREAQALARLSHENVAVVHEVGEVRGQIYLAMEYVGGGTLRSWVRAEQPPWREIVARYCAAARGLAAAHAAGLVHRDFKPANVLVGDDGRIRVTDFGLVGTTSELALPDRPPDPTGRLPTGVPLSSDITQRGDVLGTPGYVAPEVLRAQRVDARSDQYSFCVALYEALYGVKPFDGDNAAEVATNQLEGRLRPVPAEASAPSWIAGVLHRGLALNPDDRFASMDELVRALERDPSATRRRRLRLGGALAASAAVAALAVFGLTRGDAAARLCAGAERKLAGVWDAPRARQLREGFAATRLPYAPATSERVIATLDAYASRWTRMRTDACEATHVHGEQSEAVMDARMLCLNRRLGELGALVDLLVNQPDEAVVERAPTAAQALIDVDVCADIERLTALVPMPDDPALRQRVEELEHHLDEVSALSLAGKSREARRLVEPLVEQARRVEWPRAIARALAARAELDGELGDVDAAEATLREVIPLAARARDDALVARTYVSLLRAVGYSRSDFDAAMKLVPLTRAAVERAGTSGALRASLERAIGLVFDAKGRYDEALEHYQLALAGYREVHGDDHSTVAAALNDVGIMYDLQGRKQQAREVYEQVLEIERTTFGSDHPNVARTLNNLGIVMVSQGEIDAALKAYEDALAIWKAAYGDRHTRVAITLLNLGVAHSELDDWARAERAYEEALAIWRDAEGRERAYLATTLGNLGDLHEKQGECAAAIEYYERGLAVGEQIYGREHPDVSYPLVGLGNCRIALGTPAAAVAPLERAVAVRTAGGVDASEIAEAQLALSRALWLSRADRPRARELALAARETYRGADPADPGALAKADEWIAARGWR